MLRIAICDDEKLFRENIKKYVLKYLSEKDISSEIDMFNSGKELLGLGTDLLGYNIIFLDINMDEIDGIMTAHKIREYSMDIYIVFVTAYVNYSLEGYKVDATRYLLKNTINFDESIYECMDTILHKMNYIVLKKYFKFNECEKNVQVDRILYIESRLHKLEFYIMEDKLKKYSIYGKLDELEKELTVTPSQQEKTQASGTILEFVNSKIISGSWPSGEEQTFSLDSSALNQTNELSAQATLSWEEGENGYTDASLYITVHCIYHNMPFSVTTIYNAYTAYAADDENQNEDVQDTLYWIRSERR